MRPAVVDLALSGGLIAAATAVLFELANVPPPVFETFGAAPVPRAAAVLLIVAALIIGGRAVFRLGSAETAPHGPIDIEGATRVGVTFAVLVAHAAAISYLKLSFVAATVPAMFMLFLLLGGARRRVLLVGAILSVAVPPALFVFFSRIFQIDLP